MSPAKREAFILSQMHRIEYYARHFMKRYARPSGNAFEKQDLINEGVIGALNACHNYNPRMGAALATYATYRIRGAMLDFIKSRKVDPLSRNQRRACTRGEFHFKLVAWDETGEHQRVEQETAPIDIRKLFRWARLTQRERLIIYAHFIEGHDLQDLGPRLGIHASRISQLKKSAMEKLTAVANQ